jgi:hypothetical protein
MWHVDPLLRNDCETSNLISAVTRQRSVNMDRVMAFSVRSVLMTAHATIQYVMPPHGNNETATDGLCFPCGPFRDVIKCSISGVS